MTTAGSASTCPKSGFDRGGERQRGRDGVLQIGAEAAGRIGVALQRVAGLAGPRPQLADRVRHELEPLQPGGARHARQLAERRHPAHGPAGDQRPRAGLVHARHVARHREAQATVAAGAEAKLRQRDLELRPPPLGIAGHRNVPHRVPAVVLVVVVVVIAVELHADRVDGKGIGGPPVVVRVDVDAHPIGSGPHVAARQEGLDSRRVRIEGPDGDVDGLVVVGDPCFRALGRRGALGRLPLDEVPDGLGAAPEVFGQLARRPGWPRPKVWTVPRPGRAASHRQKAEAAPRKWSIRGGTRAHRCLRRMKAHESWVAHP